MKEGNGKRTREGHRQSEEHWNSFNGDIGKTSERLGAAYIGISEGIDTVLN